MTDEEFKDRLRDTKFVVRATDCEKLFLWEKHANTSIGSMERWKANDWRQLHDGRFVTVGWLKGSPVNICLSWNRIDGVLVMFYDAVSQVVDWGMIEDWLVSNCRQRWDNSRRVASCNAMNFHHVVEYVRNPESR